MQTINTGEDAGGRGTLTYAWWEYKVMHPLWDSVLKFFKS